MSSTRGELRQRLKASNGTSKAPSSSSSKPASSTRRQPPRLHDAKINPAVAFYLLLASHLLAVFTSPMPDCDEVFNYWEPTHYLAHGQGFQTWEYAPQYAIRSWAYNGIHAVIMLLARVVPIGNRPKVVEWYFMRVVFAVVCALCETRLFSKIASVLNARIAITWSIIMATSVGMQHASVAFLPSSFAMYMVMLGMAAFMDWRGGLRTAQGIFCFAVGALIGWPFAAAMAIPFLLEELGLALLGDQESMTSLTWRVIDGIVRTAFIWVVQILIDWFFYRKVVLVPLNIVLYNVFSNKGPDLYGTEPWHYYVRNLFLNFNLWTLLAIFSLPIILLQTLLGGKGALKATYLRGVVFLLPFYLWFTIFTLQPHKEERFMYPAYPALALNAAIAFHIVLANFGSTNPRHLVSKIPIQLRLLAITTFVGITVILSGSRIFGLMASYSAPYQVLTPLSNPTIARAGDTVCLGKEWHRFPSHYHLPPDIKAKFIKSDFAGLLPGEFFEGELGFRPGTYVGPAGMNDENKEDDGKYTQLKHCTFLIDSHFPSTTPSPNEPAFITDAEHWERVKCVPHLDTQSSTFLGRWGLVPQNLPIRPDLFERTFGQYCLLKKKTPRVDRMPGIETLSE